jgi:hypothetical protein
MFDVMARQPLDRRSPSVDAAQDWITLRLPATSTPFLYVTQTDLDAREKLTRELQSIADSRKAIIDLNERTLTVTKKNIDDLREIVELQRSEIEMLRAAIRRFSPEVGNGLG